MIPPGENFTRVIDSGAFFLALVLDDDSQLGHSCRVAVGIGPSSKLPSGTAMRSGFSEHISGVTQPPARMTIQKQQRIEAGRFAAAL